eukprot:g213.t1
MSKKQRQKYRKGMNHKRKRDEVGMHKIRHLNLCKAISLGEECKYGDKCKFRHDAKVFLQEKAADLGPECVFFDPLGRCPHGLNCRFGSSHINMETCMPVIRDGAVDKDKIREKLGILNISRFGIQNELRKRKVKFDRTEAAMKTMMQHRNAAKQAEAAKEAAAKAAAATAAAAEGVAKEGDAAGEAGKAGEPAAAVAPAAAAAAVAPAAAAAAAANAAAPAAAPTPAPDAHEGPIRLRPAERHKLDLRGKIYIAPLTTVGNLPYRRIMKELGADVTCGEMAMATSLLGGQVSEMALLKRHESEDIFGVQIAGNHNAVLGRCVELIEREFEVDFIDINMGCPIDGVCNKGGGSALMQRPNKIKDIVQTLLGVMQGPLTLKMRMGWSNHKPTAHNLIANVQQWSAEASAMHGGVPGVAALTLHGRSRLQRYTRSADWAYIDTWSKTQSPDLPRILTIGNGDVYNFEEWEAHLHGGVEAEVAAEEAEAMEITATAGGAAGAAGAAGEEEQEEAGGWSTSRGGGRLIKERRHWDISASERFDMLKRFVRYGLQHWGSDQHGVNTVRRFLLEWISFLCRYIPIGLLERVPANLNERPPLYVGRNDLETLMASQSVNDWIKLSEMLLGPTPEGFKFIPKHRANAYAKEVTSAQLEGATAQTDSIGGGVVKGWG